MIDPKNVTPGYWYVLTDFTDFEALNNGKLYDIVSVKEDKSIEFFGVDRNLSISPRDLYKSSLIFLSPVADPIGKPEDTIKYLKEEMNLPPNSSTADVFRNALALAKAAANRCRKDE